MLKSFPKLLNILKVTLLFIFRCNQSINQSDYTRFVRQTEEILPLQTTFSPQFQTMTCWVSTRHRQRTTILWFKTHFLLQLFKQIQMSPCHSLSLVLQANTLSRGNKTGGRPRSAGESHVQADTPAGWCHLHHQSLGCHGGSRPPGGSFSQLHKNHQLAACPVTLTRPRVSSTAASRCCNHTSPQPPSAPRPPHESCGTRRSPSPQTGAPGHCGLSGSDSAHFHESTRMGLNTNE